MSESVLLLEDDARLAEALKLVLEARGLEVRLAPTAEEGLAALRSVPPSTVVADLGLPDGGGASLVGALREAAPDARLLVLTGEDPERVRGACREAGADALLTKPVTGDELAAAIRGS